MILQFLYRTFIDCSNNAIASKAIEAFSRSNSSSVIIKSYVKAFKINQSEMEYELKKYKTLEELFIRKLKNGTRPIHQGTESVISPVDGIIEDIGRVNTNKNIVVKEKQYSITEMFGTDVSIDKYIDGHYMIIYLSPSHYHRIHSPLSGTIVNEWTLGRKSYPVNKLGIKYGKSPLSKNYRRMTEIRSTEQTHVTVAKIGAMYINSIHKTHKESLIQKGEELAYFSFGSTVILFFEKDSFKVSDDVYPNLEIKMGQKIGEIKKALSAQIR